MTWQLDPAHSSLTVSTKHMMITTVRGSLDIREAQIDFDPEAPERSSVVAVIDAGSISTGSEPRDQHLRSPDFLAAEQYPTITFRSTRIEPVRDAYRIHGELTIRDVTRPIVLDADITGVVADMRGGTRAAFSAHGRIDREEFGLNWNVALEAGGWLVGRDLKVEIELAAVQAAGAKEEKAAAA